MNVWRAAPVTPQARSTIFSALRSNLFSTSSSPVTKDQEPAVDADMPHPDMENPFQKERRLCILCKHNIDVDYKV
ncbi:mitochondrial ribosomal protein S18C isoform X2 [Haemaphysalis longicornis]